MNYWTPTPFSFCVKVFYSQLPHGAHKHFYCRCLSDVTSLHFVALSLFCCFSIDVYPFVKLPEIPGFVICHHDDALSRDSTVRYRYVTRSFSNCSLQ